MADSLYHAPHGIIVNPFPYGFKTVSQDKPASTMDIPE